MKVGRTSGNKDDENTPIGAAIKTLAEQSMTGKAMLRMNAEKLVQVGLKWGPAELLAEEIEKLVPQSGLQ
eukprot:971454-Amphidinium_carterae.1